MRIFSKIAAPGSRVTGALLTSGNGPTRYERGDQRAMLGVSVVADKRVVKYLRSPNHALNHTF
jgi:hypothetical protein